MSNSPSQTTENEPCETLHPSDFTSLNGLSQLLKAYLKILSKIISGQCGMAQRVKRLLSKGKDLSSTLHSLHRAVHSVILSFKLCYRRDQRVPRNLCAPHEQETCLYSGRWEAPLKADLWPPYKCCWHARYIQTAPTHRCTQEEKEKKEGRKENASGIWMFLTQGNKKSWCGNYLNLPGHFTHTQTHMRTRFYISTPKWK